MSAQIEIDSFAESMTNLQKSWSQLKPNERLAKIQALVNSQAKSSGFPSPQIQTADDLGPQRPGELRFRDWEIALNESLIQSNRLTSKQTAQLGEVLYHEIRHAEQWSLIARRQAAEGQSAEQIKRQLQVPEKVATEATKQPLGTSDPRRACADVLHKSVYGENAVAHNTTLTNLSTQSEEVNSLYDEYHQAKTSEDELRSKLALDDKNYSALSKQRGAAKADLYALAAHYSETDAALRNAEAMTDARLEAAEAANASYQKTYADYRALPEEADAWDAGGRAARAIKAHLTSRLKVLP